MVKREQSWANENKSYMRVDESRQARVREFLFDCEINAFRVNGVVLQLLNLMN